jgi:hypothetical protein
VLGEVDARLHDGEMGSHGSGWTRRAGAGGNDWTPSGIPSFAYLVRHLYTRSPRVCRKAVPGITSFSFVDDVTWLDQQRTFQVVSKRFRDVSRVCLRWAENNAARFKWPKTEAIPFSRSLKARKEALEHDSDLISPQDQHHKVRWNKEVTWWLGVYLDHSLTFATHRKKVLSKAKSGA